VFELQLGGGIVVAASVLNGSDRGRLGELEPVVGDPDRHPASGKVTFTVTNAGTITHEFVVLKTDTPSADIEIGKFEGEADRINEDTAGTNVGETGDMQPGATSDLTLDLKPGHYVFLCNLPGHYMQGMHVDVTVS
jgi:uncharacterized cupredoxin-like copper-binding protein